MPYGLNRQFYRARLVTPPRIRRTFSVAARRAQGYSPYARAAAGRFARRTLYRRALTGGAIAAGGLAAYGMYRGIRRFRRRRTARSTHRSLRRHVGVRVGSSRTKEKLTQEVHENKHTSYNLHSHEVTTIGALDSTNQFRRQRNDINLRGFRLNLRVGHNSAKPGVLTMMLVSFKHGANINAVDNDFFKGPNGDEISFPTAAGVVKGSDYVDFGYNKEIMNVLWYKRLQLAPKQGINVNPYTMQSGKNYVQLNEYVKMNRQINFNLDTDISPEAPHSVYFLHWYANPFEASDTRVPEQYTMTRKISAIWRELTH